MAHKYKYTAISFAPVQGFIEKSRKLRDLYGASRILSHLTYKLIKKIKEFDSTIEIISPGISGQLEEGKEGLPNRVLVKGSVTKEQAEDFILSTWRDVLKQCRYWIENKFHKYDPDYQFYWESQWQYWNQNTWEIFWGGGDDIQEAIEDLETKKLSRSWTVLNWIGESSSLTGTDAIIHPDINNRQWFDPKKSTSKEKQEKIKNFYHYLSFLLELHDQELNKFQDLDNKEPEGKFLDSNERLSVPELVKRLVTREDIGKKLDKINLDKSFTDIERVPPKDSQKKEGQWTGWFMGDGDKVGEKLKELVQQGDEAIQSFTTAMRDWGKQFQNNFNNSQLGRVIYAGGDDFLGVIYSKNINQPIPSLTALNWLRNFRQEWSKNGQEIGVSVGFVWAAPRVPQRDILQHCREAEQKAKSLGRDRLTIRIVFNSGQYIGWTVPWKHLDILTKYQDREGIQYKNNDLYCYQNRYGNNCDCAPNWSHIYQDLAYLKARHVIEIPRNEGQKLLCDETIALKLMDLYFPGYGKYLDEHAEQIVGDSLDIGKAILSWIDGLIHIGWYLCA